MRRKKFNVANLYLVVVFALLYIPIFYLIIYAFNKGDSMNAFTGFTLKHFSAVFADSRLIIILLDTFKLAFLSALIATLIGTFGAMGIY